MRQNISCISIISVQLILHICQGTDGLLVGIDIESNILKTNPVTYVVRGAERVLSCNYVNNIGPVSAHAFAFFKDGFSRISLCQCRIISYLFADWARGRERLEKSGPKMACV